MGAVSPRAVEKRARPGNEGTFALPGELTAAGALGMAGSASQQQAAVAEFVPEVVIRQSGVVGALDGGRADHRLQ